MTKETEERRPKLAVVVGALALLHVLTALRLPWESGGAGVAWTRVNPDLAALLGLGIFVTFFFGGRRLLSHVIALLLIVAVVYRFASTAVPAFYGTDFNLYADVTYASGLWHLLTHEHPPEIRALIGVSSAVGLVVVHYVVCEAVRAVLRAGAARRFTLGVGSVLLVLGAVGLLGAQRAEVSKLEVFGVGTLVPFASDLIELRVEIEAMRDYRSLLEEIRVENADLPGGLAGLDGADVYLHFIESYGRVLLKKPSMRAPFEEWAASWEVELETQGIGVRSGYVFPRVRGGGSSLAHAQILSGAPVRNRRHFGAILESSLKPLPHYFREAGYRTINVQPMMPAPWPKGAAFLGFSEEMFHSDFPYAGFRYHWGEMPDQFALAHLLRTAVEPSRQPLFAMFVSVSSHSPYRTVPPYLEDWGRVLEPDAYSDGPAHEYDIDWATFTHHPESEQGYTQLIRYSLDCVVGFVRELERPSLVFVLGDHQPPPIGDMRTHDRSSDVPMHVLSNDPDLLAPFEDFVEGFVPSDVAPSRPTTMFQRYFLESFSAPR